jgi:bifunctional DNA-binding transcriptional regulator/antitoxin component of YhaV-PrlF toxin-antitoxin module
VDTPLVPSGPRKVLPKKQLTIPGELLEAIGVHQGDRVFLMLNPDKPGTIVVIPEPLMAEVVREEWTAI